MGIRIVPRPPSVGPDDSLSVVVVMYGWADSGGGTILPRQVARAFAARGHRVTVFYAGAQRRPDLPPYGVEETTEDGVHLVGLFNRPSLFRDLDQPDREVDDPGVTAAFRQLLARVRPDVVHFFNLHNLGMSLATHAKRAGAATIYSSNNYWPICPRLYLFRDDLSLCAGPSNDGQRCATCVGASADGHARRLASARTLLDVDIDVHLAVSERVRELYVQGGANGANIRVLHQQPPAVDSNWRNVGRTRPIVEVLDRPLHVAFVGSVMPHKGVHVLVRALQLVGADVECTVHGDLMPDYARALHEMDRTGRVRFAGRYAADDMPAILSAADVAVIPSVWEDCAPFVVAESLAARVPVVGSRFGGIPDFVEDGRTGFLFTPGDASDLARCLLRFVEDRRLLGRMQRAIAEPRGFDAYLDDLQRVYSAPRRELVCS